VFLLWVYLSWLVVIFGAVVVASLPEWREAAGQRQPVPGTDFFDALQILKILWRAHRGGDPVTLSMLLGAATVRIESVERILDTMVGAGWIRRTLPTGWVLHRDAASITVEDVFGLFVFRGEAHRPGREADPALEALVHAIGSRMSQSMRTPLTVLFRAAEQNELLPGDADESVEPVNVRAAP
jgi:membrane protein